MCNHLSGKELLTGKGKSEEGERREKGGRKEAKSNGCTPIFFFGSSKVGFIYPPPPPQKKKKKLLEERSLFGGYILQHSAGDILGR